MRLCVRYRSSCTMESSRRERYETLAWRHLEHGREPLISKVQSRVLSRVNLSIAWIDILHFFGCCFHCFTNDNHTVKRMFFNSPMIIKTFWERNVFLQWLQMNTISLSLFRYNPSCVYFALVWIANARDVSNDCLQTLHFCSLNPFWCVLINDNASTS